VAVDDVRADPGSIRRQYCFLFSYFLFFVFFIYLSDYINNKSENIFASVPGFSCCVSPLAMARPGEGLSCFSWCV
jgi:hypothetical protein